MSAPALVPGVVLETWLKLSPDEEVLALLRLVEAVLERRGYVPRVEWVMPEVKPAA